MNMNMNMNRYDMSDNCFVKDSCPTQSLWDERVFDFVIYVNGNEMRRRIGYFRCAYDAILAVRERERRRILERLRRRHVRCCFAMDWETCEVLVVNRQTKEKCLFHDVPFCVEKRYTD